MVLLFIFAYRPDESFVGVDVPDAFGSAEFVFLCCCFVVVGMRFAAGSAGVFCCVIVGECLSMTVAVALKFG